MRTKTLLAAAAALAASLFTSQAAVTSANVVGYATIPTPGSGGSFYMMNVPFNIGVSNGANEVFGATLPDFSQLLIWDPATATYTTYFSDSTSPTLWDDNNFSPVGPPSLPPGKGFFFIPSADVTNTFTGSVAVSTGTSNSMVLNGSGGTFYMVGSVVPYGGSITNGNSSTGGANLNGLPDFSQVLVWNTATAQYTTYFSDSSSPTLWDDNNFSPVDPPALNVGQGIFVIPSDNYVWTTGL